MSTLARSGRPRARVWARLLSLSGVARALLAITGLAAVLRLATLDRQSFWFDEAYAVLLLELPFGEMLSRLPSYETTPPLYLVLASAWTEVFGTGEVGLRGLSALFGTATVPVVYLAGRELVSRRAGLVAAGLVAVSPLLWWYSQEGRTYALFAFLSAASVLFFARALARPDARQLALWALASALALTSHYFAVFLVLAEAVLLAARFGRRRAFLLSLAFVGAVGAALLPLALAQQSTGHTDWIAGLGLTDRMKEVLGQFVLGEYADRHPRLWIAAPLLFVLLAVAVWRWSSGKERRGAEIALALGLGSLLAPLSLGLVGVDVFYYRNLIGSAIPLALFAGAALTVERRPALRVAALGVCAASAAIVITIAIDESRHRQDWRGATEILGAPSAQRVVAVFPPWQDVVYSLYRPSVPLPDRGARAREIDVVGYALGSLELQTPPGFRQIQTSHVGFLTVLRFRSNKPQLVAPERLSSGRVAPTFLLDEPRSGG